MSVTITGLDEAQNDWDNVQEIVPKFKSEDVQVLKDSGQAPFVTLEEVVSDFRSQDLSSQRAQVEVVICKLNFGGIAVRFLFDYTRNSLDYIIGEKAAWFIRHVTRMKFSSCT